VLCSEHRAGPFVAFRSRESTHSCPANETSFCGAKSYARDQVRPASGFAPADSASERARILCALCSSWVKSSCRSVQFVAHPWRAGKLGPSARKPCLEQTQAPPKVRHFVPFCDTQKARHDTMKHHVALAVAKSAPIGASGRAVVAQCAGFRDSLFSVQPLSKSDTHAYRLSSTRFFRAQPLVEPAGRVCDSRPKPTGVRSPRHWRVCSLRKEAGGGQPSSTWDAL